MARALIENSSLPAGATIAVTDINTTFLDELNKLLEENRSWPVESQVTKFIVVVSNAGDDGLR